MLRAISVFTLLFLFAGCAGRPAAENPPLLTSARLEKVGSQGTVSAVRLRDVQPDSAWTKFGFREGDEVTAIDGRPVTRQDDLFHLLEVMADPGLHEIQVSRAGSHRLENLRVRSAR